MKSLDIPLRCFNESTRPDTSFRSMSESSDTDTLMVFGLDHLVSEQEASSGEIQAVREWLKREGTCLMLGPHHDVGFTEDLQQRQLEYTHHGDALVPRQQRFGQYTCSMMKALGVPVMNQFGLRPALVKGPNKLPR